MLKLVLIPTSTWLELGGGVRVRVPPLTPAILRAAEYESARAYADRKRELNGGDDAVELTDAQIGQAEGVHMQAKIRSLCNVIEDWEGVTDEGGHGLTQSPEVLDAFAAHALIGPAFLNAYNATVAPLVAEGNGSPNTSNGNGAVETGTVQGAAPAVGADAGGAPPSVTPPDPLTE